MDSAAPGPRWLSGVLPAVLRLEAARAVGGGSISVCCWAGVGVGGDYRLCITDRAGIPALMLWELLTAPCLSFLFLKVELC